jgi:hypothetical protein
VTGRSIYFLHCRTRCNRCQQEAGEGGADSRIRTDDQRFTKPLTFTENQQLKTAFTPRSQKVLQ